MTAASPLILIASDQTPDAELVRRLLSSEFPRTVPSTDPQGAVADFETHRPDVLVLAFNTLEKAEACYLGVHRLGKAVHATPHRTIVLCTKDEVRKVYELCRRRYFDDYVVFWPLGHDVTRLLMSVHQAWRSLSGTQREEFEPQAVVRAQVPLSRVLVVDDDPFQHRLLRRLLADEHVDLIEALSGLEAVELASSQRPDLILMDVDMPDVDGLETTRRLKASAALAAIPVIMITGHGDKTTVVESLNAGAVDFAVKPLERAVLVAKLRKALADV